MIELPPLDARTVLLLHGEGGPSSESRLIAALGPGVAAPQCPGFGGEPLPVWLRSVDQLSYHYLDAIEAAATAPVFAVGVSFGAWLLLEIATKQPQRFAGLVLVAPVGVKVNGRDEAQFADLFAAGIEDQTRLLYADPDAQLARLRAAGDDYLHALALAQEALARFAWEPYLHNPLLIHRLHRVRCPSAIVYGANDRLVANVTYYKDMADRLGGPVTLTAVENAGHRVADERPDAVADIIHRFIDGNR